MDITQLDYKKAMALFPVADAAKIKLDKSVVSFLENEDYYQAGEQYVGPKAAPGDTVGKAYIEQSFVSLAKLGELNRRYVAGAVGQEPSFETVDAVESKDANGELIASAAKTLADAAIGDWFDREQMAETIEIFTSRLCASNVSYFRYGVPPGFVKDFTDAAGSVISAVDAQAFDEAIQLIYCESPKSGRAYVYVDSSTRQEYGVYSYSETEVDSEGNSKTINCVEISTCPTRDENGKKLDLILTNVRIVKDNGSVQDFVLDTGGVPLVIKAEFDPLVFSPLASDANIRLNNAANSAATMAKINADVAGFPETKHIDLEPPVVDTGRSDAKGEPIYESVDVQSGPRATAFLTSVRDEVKADGKTSVAARSGTIIYRQPVSSAPLLEVIDFYLRELYTAANQAHVLEPISAAASGIARVEARADFARAILKIARKVEGALRDLLRGVRCLAAYLSNDQLEEMKALRDNVTAHPNSGALTPDEKRLILEMVAAEVISRELAMVMLGIEDIDAEIAKINAERYLRDFGEPVAPDAPKVGGQSSTQNENQT